MARNENNDQNRGQNPSNENQARNEQNKPNQQNPQGQKGQPDQKSKTNTPTGQQDRESNQLGQQKGKNKGMEEGDTFENEQTKGQANESKEGSVGQGPSQSGRHQSPGEQNADDSVRGRTGTTPTEKSGRNPGSDLD